MHSNFDTSPERAPADPVAFDPARTVRPRRDGWTAERQRTFIRTLAATGCATHAAATVGLSPSSAYRLAAKPEAACFARAWDEALLIAGRRLLSLAVERVVEGTSETFWKDGVCVGERRRPSERLHIFLLQQLHPNGLVRPRELLWREVPADVATGELPLLMEEFEDDDDPAEEWDGEGAGGEAGYDAGGGTLPVQLPGAPRVDP